MIHRIGLQFVLFVLLALTIFLLASHLQSEWMIWIALAMIVAATLWFAVALFGRPRQAAKSLKSWWRIVWDALRGCDPIATNALH